MKKLRLEQLIKEEIEDLRNTNYDPNKLANFLDSNYDILPSDPWYRGDIKKLDTKEVIRILKSGISNPNRLVKDVLTQVNGLGFSEDISDYKEVRDTYNTKATGGEFFTPSKAGKGYTGD